MTKPTDIGVSSHPRRWWLWTVGAFLLLVMVAYLATYWHYRCAHVLIHRQTTAGSQIVIGDSNPGLFLLAGDTEAMRAAADDARRRDEWILWLFTPLRFAEATLHELFGPAYEPEG